MQKKDRTSSGKNKNLSMLIMGIGNPILTDDGVSLMIAHGLKDKRPDLEIIETMETGIGILDMIVGYEKLVVIDSIKTGKDRPGSLYRLDKISVGDSLKLSCAHAVDITSAIRMGRMFGYAIPKKIAIYAVEIEDNTTFGEGCTSAVSDRVLLIIEEILKDINEGLI
jgi:hydrogenase maturation protease